MHYQKHRFLFFSGKALAGRCSSTVRRLSTALCFSTAFCLSTTLIAAEDTGGLWVSTSQIEPGLQMLLVVDPETKVLAVYHVESSNGKVSLRSTRALGYDLQIEDFNATEPKPSSIKKMLRVDSVPKPQINKIEIIPPSPIETRQIQPSP
ncbi:MAG: hypothetical protein HN985_00205 [Planctomycetaceae bacterium]|mgnify:CR=1 FL=1|nr:hypothetical protein [Planctomycetaceae bacterium]MBT6918118.1 hypothetical protein [Planctomycetaceae bacterium]MBT7729414.1 hypothetical protein [Planctomycetaceae bacterium]